MVAADGTTVMMKLWYRYDTDAAPVAYQVTGSVMRWVTSDDKTFVNLYAGMITPNMTTDQFNALMAYFNQLWNATDHPGTPHTNAGAKTRAQWDAQCDDLYTKSGYAMCGLLAGAPTTRPYVAPCIVLMNIGYTGCKALGPPPDAPGMPIGYIWCKPAGGGMWDVKEVPWLCGPDPNELIVQECLDDYPFFGAKYGYYLDAPVYLANVGGYMAIANCHNAQGTVVYTPYAEYYAICAPPMPSAALDQIWLVSGGNPIPYACVDHHPPSNGNGNPGVGNPPPPPSQ